MLPGRLKVGCHALNVKIEVRLLAGQLKQDGADEGYF